jgi:hypothetical protein
MRENHHAEEADHRTSPLLITLAWAAVITPLAWGFVSTLIEASKLFY